jgi:hypothetical protein
LAVDATDELDRATGQPAHQVAGEVEAVAGRAERVGGELFRGQCRLPPIAEGQPVAGNAPGSASLGKATRPARPRREKADSGKNFMTHADFPGRQRRPTRPHDPQKTSI